MQVFHFHKSSTFSNEDDLVQSSPVQFHYELWTKRVSKRRFVERDYITTLMRYTFRMSSEQLRLHVAPKL